MAAVKSTFLIVLVGVAVAIEAKCPPESPVVQCFSNPCDWASCPAYPLATCRPNYCGGCFAEFFVEGTQVNCDVCRDGSKPLTCDMHPCATARPAPGYICVPDYCNCNCGMNFVKLCPDGSQPDECLLDPCATTVCPVGASCVSDRCGKGGCAASCVPNVQVKG